MLVAIPFLLCWGSFLNALSYRLIRNKSIITPRSQCPECHHQLAWYDLIPVFSWIMLGGKCRYCHKPISLLYPFIELLTVGVMLPLLYLVPLHYIPAYFLFFSALIVTIRSDLESMLISRFVTLFLIPCGVMLSFFNLLPISYLDSMLGVLLGYGFLFGMAKLFKALTGKEGMGQGDLELLAFIGSFTGVFGCWFSVLVGSVFGSVIGVIYALLIAKNRNVRIPFGPFLAFGAIVYVLFQDYFISYLFPA